MKKLFLTGSLFTILTLLASCSVLKEKQTININNNSHNSGNVTNTSTSTTTTTSSKKHQTISVDKILLGEWTATSVNDRTIEGDERPYVIFDTTAVNENILKVYANNGCNTLNGEVAVTAGGEMKKTSTFATTMRLCPNAPYERDINLALETVNSFKIDKNGQDYQLSLINQSGKVTMTLSKSNIAFMNGAWKVTKIGNISIGEDKDIKMVIDIPELKLHGNGGCNVVNGKIFIDPAKTNAIQFTDLITTMMYCPDLQLEQQFLVALEEVETAVSENNGNTALLKDDSGKVVLVLKKMELK